MCGGYGGDQGGAVPKNGSSSERSEMYSINSANFLSGVVGWVARCGDDIGRLG